MFQSSSEVTTQAAERNTDNLSALLQSVVAARPSLLAELCLTCQVCEWISAAWPSPRHRWGMPYSQGESLPGCSSSSAKMTRAGEAPKTQINHTLLERVNTPESKGSAVRETCFCSTTNPAEKPKYSFQCSTWQLSLLLVGDKIIT